MAGLADEPELPLRQVSEHSSRQKESLPASANFRYWPNADRSRFGRIHQLPLVLQGQQHNLRLGMSVQNDELLADNVLPQVG